MKRLVLYIITIFSVLNALAQVETNQEVKVIKAYEPVISDAYKITELPKIIDTAKVKPKFDYEISPVKFTTSFQPKSIKPARLVNEPLSKLYYGYTRLGFGSYLSPLAEVSVGSQRSDQWLWDAGVHYSSSNGKVKNEAGEKVYAGLSNFSVGGNGKYFLKNETALSMSAAFTSHSSYYYGYNPNSPYFDVDTVSPPLLKDDIEKQRLQTIKVGALYETNYIDSSHVNFKIYANYRHAGTYNDATEGDFNLGTNINRFFEKQFLGVDAEIRSFSNQGFIDTVNYALVNFSPWIGAFSSKWQIVVGINTFFKTDSSQYKIYPKVSLHYNIIDYFLIPYFEFSGNYKLNTFGDIYRENNFVLNNLVVQPTNNKFNLTFGFRGNISSQVAFNLKAEYAGYGDQYFYVNDTSIDLQNKFGVVYDDMNRFRFLGEISYKKTDKLFIALKGNYYSYDLKNEAYAWHMPEYEVSLNTRYSIQDKIITEISVFGIGKRYAREYDDLGNEVAKELSGILDLNLGVEYRYTKILSAFLKLNNLAAVKYYKWNNYPTQQFNLMLGITYSF